VVGTRTGHLPTDERHLVVRAMRAAFDAMGGQPPGLSLQCTNAIPQGRGLGSSAAAIVAGVLGARALVADGAERMDDAALLDLAADLEGHPDNVAACLRGGLTLAWRRPAGVAAVRLDVRLAFTLFVPPRSYATSTARRLLPEVVAHADAVRTAGRAALLVAVLTTGEPTSDLLLDATDDWLHQPSRAAAMPESWQLMRRLRAGGIPAVLSGAGPAVLAFRLPGQDVAGDGPSAAARWGAPGWDVREVEIDQRGARLTAARDGMPDEAHVF